MNTYSFIEKTCQIARCLLLVSLVSFAFPAAGWGNTIFQVHFTDENDITANQFEWFDEEETDSYDLETTSPGWLKINAGVRQDIWDTPWKRGAPIMFHPIPSLISPWWVLVTGDYTARTRVSASPLGNPSQTVNTQMGLFIFKDEHNWLFFGLTNHNFNTDPPLPQNGLILTKTFNGSSSVVEGNNLTEDFVDLKIERIKEGNEWEFYWKVNPNDGWIKLTTIQLDLGDYKDHKVGMGVKTFDHIPPFNSAQANFDLINIEVYGESILKKIIRYFEEWKDPWPWEIVLPVLMGSVVLLFFLVRRILNRRK